ncbi:hypothetical protein COU79_01600 [Candidatus Peregrinibacteria bacterium CG10_big_fil_rev_8_21_14_0_10_54_7]|nr:MAG: hypothetical protein COU79_01600 [Candidatus Peregrinibacteria bacterium CG10_big_fil_rev_8_21_14_0_10_54_7]
MLRKNILHRRLKATKLHFHRKRHRRKLAQILHPFAVLVVSMVVATGVITHESLTRADILPPLHNFRIRPLDSTEMEVGQNLRLTAEGYYGTSPVVVKAQWNLLGDQSLGYLADCGESQDCTFVALNPGTTVIEAETHDQFAHVTVDIRGPVTPVQNTFTDTLPPWAERPILDLRQRSIIHGYEDGRFGSADTLTKGQLITLIYRMLLHLELISAPANCRQYYDDVPPDHFAYDAACVFFTRGWSSGLRQFDTDAPASRAQAAQFMHSILGAPLLEHWGLTLGAIAREGELYPDVPEDHYIFYESAVLNRAGIMTGYGSGLFGPEDTLNRAQAATLVHRALRKAEELQLRLF